MLTETRDGISRVASTSAPVNGANTTGLSAVTVQRDRVDFSDVTSRSR